MAFDDAALRESFRRSQSRDRSHEYRGVAARCRIRYPKHEADLHLRRRAAPGSGRGWAGVIAIGRGCPRTGAGQFRNHALENNDTKALDLLLADTFVSIDIDGSIQNKGEFLASLKTPGYQAPSQSVTEQSKVDVYGDSAVVSGVFRTRSIEKRKTVIHRERFLDTWVNLDHTWKCVASVAVLIPGK